MAFADVTKELQEIQQLKNWVIWQFVPDKNGGKPKKMPSGTVNNPNTWSSYKEAFEKFIYDNNAKGLGFMFGTEENPSGYAGIDLDNVILPDGTLKPFAAEIVQIMNSYTEYSPSKTGLHILFKLKNRLQKEGYYFKHDDIECYDCMRYFTITGDTYGDSKPIEYRDSECQMVREKFLKRDKVKPEAKANTETDSELLQKMFKNIQTGKRIEALFNGDISGYESSSNADLALCSYLAWWTKKDYARIDSLFRQSGLYRPKWDELHGAQTYGAMTIEKAIAGTPDSVLPQKKPEKPEIKFDSDAQYLERQFESDIKNFQRYSNRKTGFSNLDSKLTLYPGLYILGAISSLGKTTLNLQIADNLASAGEHVLYFAFEQTRFELVSKSLARLAQPEHAFFDSNPTAIEIRNGRISPEVRNAIEKFKIISEHKQIIECNFTTDISVIVETVNEYIKQFGVKPVVFVDYLQLIRSDNPKLTATKDIVDANVRALKLLQMQNELVMFVVSSLNRQNYMTVIDFESFKETGGIEYTADCIIGLQLAIMNTKLFESDAKITKKRKAVKAAKVQKPRYIELCILKNRYGVSNESFFFEYYQQWDKFIPTTLESIQRECLNLINSIPDDEENDIKRKPR